MPHHRKGRGVRDHSLLLLIAIVLRLDTTRACPLAPSRNLVLESQQDVWASANCSEIPGALYVSGDVTDLSPLRGVSSVGADVYGDSLWIHNCPELQSLAGLRLSGRLPGAILVNDNAELLSLEGLELVAGAGRGFGGASLWVTGNPSLASLAGLDGLRGELLGAIKLVNNSKLLSMKGLDGISAVGRSFSGHSLTLETNPRLLSCAGLGGVRELRGSLDIEDMSGLETLAGLENVATVGIRADGSSVFISDAPSLRSLDGISGLQGGLPGSLVVHNCGALASLDGLERVTALGRDSDGVSLAVSGNLALRSVRGLRGLSGPLPGALVITECPELVSLFGLQGVTSLGRAFNNLSLLVNACPSLRTLTGLRGLRGPSPGAIALMSCASLRSLSGLEGVTSVNGTFREGHSIMVHTCPELESLAGLGGLRGPLLGGISVRFCPGLRSLAGFAEGVTAVTSAGSVIVQLSAPVCFQAEARSHLAGIALPSSLARSIFIPDGAPAGCTPCGVDDCGTHADRAVGCDVLRGGRCMCPLLASGPGCQEESPTVLVDGVPSWEVQAPPPGTPPLEIALRIPLRRRGGNESSRPPTTAVQVIDLRTGTAVAGLDFALWPSRPDDVNWYASDGSRGHVMARLRIEADTFGSAGRKTVELGLAYLQDMLPDHVIEGTADLSSDPLDLRYPECLFDGACNASVLAGTLHILKHEGCQRNMISDSCHCMLDALCPSQGHPAGPAGNRTDSCLGSKAAEAPSPTQSSCECLGSRALVPVCRAEVGYWSPDGQDAFLCPYREPPSCLGGNVCAEGYSGTLCAECATGHLPVGLSCEDCSPAGVEVSVVVLGAFVAMAVLAPHLRALLRKCRLSGRLHMPAHEVLDALRPKLRIQILTAQVLAVWPKLFYLKFPALPQHMARLHDLVLGVANFLSVALASVLPTSLRCALGLGVVGEFAVFMLGPLLFVGLSAVSARLRWPRSRALAATAEVAFWVSYLTYSPQSASVVLHLPIKGVNFDCRLESQHGCRFRTDYTLGFDDYQSAMSAPVYAALAVYPVGVPLAYLVLLCRKRGIFAKREVFDYEDVLLSDADREELRSYAALYADFHPKAYFFEVVNLFRQLFINALVLALPEGATVHLLASLLIMLGYLLLILKFQPYRRKVDNVVSELCCVSIIMLFVTQLAALKEGSATSAGAVEDPRQREFHADLLLGVTIAVYVGLALLVPVALLIEMAPASGWATTSGQSASRAVICTGPWQVMHFCNSGFLNAHQANRTGLSLRSWLEAAADQAIGQAEADGQNELRDRALYLREHCEFQDGLARRPFGNLWIRVFSRVGALMPQEGQNIRRAMEQLLRSGLGRTHSQRTRGRLVLMASWPSRQEEEEAMRREHHCDQSERG